MERISREPSVISPIKQGLIEHGTIVTVHNLRNAHFLPHYGFGDIPLMISAADLTDRPNLRRSIEKVGIKRFLGATGPIIIDSGGFSFMTGAYTKITVDQLVAIYRQLGADLYAVLDLPPGLADGVQQRSHKWCATLVNFDRMLHLLGRDQLLPIIHGRTLREIVAACRDVRQRIERPPMVALGGMVPFIRGHMSEQRFHYKRLDGSTASGEVFVADAIAACRDQFPASHLHVLGVGSTTTAIAVLALGAHSVDSLAWRRAAGFGTIFLAGLAERIVSTAKRERSSRPQITVADHQALMSCRCPICSTRSHFGDRIEALSSSYVTRAVHNVWTLQAEQIAFRNALTTGTLAAFSSSRVKGRHRFAKIVLNHFGL